MRQIIILPGVQNCEPARGVHERRGRPYALNKYGSYVFALLDWTIVRVSERESAAHKIAPFEIQEVKLK